MDVGAGGWWLRMASPAGGDGLAEHLDWPSENQCHERNDV